MSEQSRRRFTFGPFALDETQHLLLRDGEAVGLPPKCFDLLRLLVSNPGQLMEKDRLMRELWPETFVEEANLSNMVALLRKALGDSPASSRYIQTVPKHGYRFVAPSRNPQPPSREVSGGRQAIRILVFPFRTQSGVTDLQHLAYSLPEAISATLAELNAFTVRSIQLAMRFDQLKWDPRTVGKETDVDVILTGTLETQKAGIHSLTQLVETRTGELLWSKSWDVDGDDLFRFHQGVVQLIIRTLIRGGCENTQQSLPVDAPTSTEAYQLYLRANQLTSEAQP